MHVKVGGIEEIKTSDIFFNLGNFGEPLSVYRNQYWEQVSTGLKKVIISLYSFII